MIRELNRPVLLGFGLVIAAILAVLTWATVDSWGAAREVEKPEQVYKPSVRRHGNRHFYYYNPSRTYRGFYDGGPGTPK